MPLHKHHLSYLIAALLAGVLLPSTSHAQADALVRHALEMTQNGQARQAFDLLAPLEVQRAGDPDYDAVLGIAANEAGEFSRAIFALERALLVQPANARVRAELGRALFAVGDTAGARTVLQQTKDQGVPAAAAGAIDQFLKAIDKVEEAKKSSWKGYVELGGGSDSNINSGPSTSNVAVPAFGGLVLTLSPAGVKTAASFASAGAGVSGRYVIDSRLSLLGNAATSARANTGDGQFNTVQTDLSAGAAYRLEKNEYGVAAQYSTTGVGGNTARNSAGLVGEWVYRFDGNRQVTSYAQWSRLSYPAQSARDAKRSVIGANYAHALASGMLVFGGAYVGREKEVAAGVPHLGHRLGGFRAGMQMPVNDTLSAFASLGYERRDFGGTDPLFAVNRQDSQTNLNLGLNWLPAAQWRVTPQVALTRAASNIPINDFSKRQISVVGRREF